MTILKRKSCYFIIPIITTYSSATDYHLYYLFLMSGLLDWGKNLLNKGVQELGKKWSPPPEKDMFQLTGELSPDEFKRAGNHLIKICNGWQWKPAEKKELISKYLKENEQYLLLEKAICRRRLNSNL